jgi:hypothetical protein
MQVVRLWILAAVLAPCPGAAADDYVYSDAFEIRLCDGVGCSFCSPVDPLPLCGTQSHCLPQQDGSSMCTYPAGGGTQGATCTSLAACAGPYLCADTGIAAKCLHWCSRPSGTECLAFAGTTCVSLSPAVSIGSLEWGVCL